jgi:hypothetical protein
MNNDRKYLKELNDWKARILQDIAWLAEIPGDEDDTDTDAEMLDYVARLDAEIAVVQRRLGK